MSNDNQVYTPEAFALEVENRVMSGVEPSYITATSDLIEEMDCDPDEVKHLLSPTLIAKIKAEASKRGLLKEKHLSSDLTSFFTS